MDKGSDQGRLAAPPTPQVIGYMLDGRIERRTILTGMLHVAPALVACQRAIRHRSDQSEEGSPMRYTVGIEQVGEQLVAVARERTTLARVAQDIRRLVDRPWALFKERPDLRADGHNVAIYFGTLPDDTVEVGVRIVKRFKATDSVVCSATPAGRVATTRHVGPYSELGRAHAAVRDWCASGRHKITGLAWEIYGDWSDDPAKQTTDVIWLLA